MKLPISSIRATPAPPAVARSGLLAWVSCIVGGELLIDGLALRRTVDGRLTLSFPSRRDRAGREHAYVRPLGDGVRQAIERQVLDALDLSGAVPHPAAPNPPCAGRAESTPHVGGPTDGPR
jgi:DNA-binding cell septation regulator SpoVG